MRYCGAFIAFLEFGKHRLLSVFYAFTIFYSRDFDLILHSRGGEGFYYRQQRPAAPDRVQILKGDFFQRLFDVLPSQAVSD
jgi:hypothetical protein